MRSLLSRDKSVIGVVGLIAFFGIFVLVFLKIPQGLVSEKGKTVTAVFKNPGQLSKDDPVRVDGVVAGKVTDLKLLPGGRGTEVKLEVFDDALPLYRNARADVRWRTLLGASFVVDLRRGTPAAGKADLSNEIPTSRTSNQVEVDELTDIVKGGAQNGLRQTLKELPKAFSDHEAPAAALDAAGDVAPSLEKATGALRGQSPGDITSLVRDTDTLVRQLDTPTEDVRQLVEGGASTVGITARRASDLQATIDAAQRVFPAIRTTSRRIDTTLANADPLLADLQRPAGQIGPTAAKLRPTVVEADALLDKARPLLSSLRPAARSLAKSARTAQPVLDHLEPDLKLIDEKLLPDLARRSPESQRTTYEMLGPTFEALHVPFGYFDGNGSYVRFLASGGSDILDAAPCRTLIADPTASQLITCDELKNTIARLFGVKRQSSKGLLKP